MARYWELGCLEIPARHSRVGLEEDQEEVADFQRQAEQAGDQVVEEEGNQRKEGREVEAIPKKGEAIPKKGEGPEVEAGDHLEVEEG